jgi:hypothetical protein
MTVQHNSVVTLRKKAAMILRNGRRMRPLSPTGGLARVCRRSCALLAGSPIEQGGPAMEQVATLLTLLVLLILVIKL